MSSEEEFVRRFDEMPSKRVDAQGVNWICWDDWMQLRLEFSPVVYTPMQRRAYQDTKNIRITLVLPDGRAVALTK